MRVPIKSIEVSGEIQAIAQLLTKEFEQHQFVVNVCTKDYDSIRALNLRPERNGMGKGFVGQSPDVVELRRPFRTFDEIGSMRSGALVLRIF